VDEQIVTQNTQSSSFLDSRLFEKITVDFLKYLLAAEACSFLIKPQKSQSSKSYLTW
jgi:hypothetical protein